MRDVFEPEPAGGARHRFDVGASVGGGRVHVEVAAEVLPLDRGAGASAPPRPRSRRGSRAIPAESSPARAPRRCPLQSRRRSATSSSTRKSPYSLSFRPRWIARSRSAMLCAFEPVKYCCAAPRLSRGNEPEVGLEPAPEQHARLRFAAGEHALDQAVSDEGVHQRRGRAGGEDVEVATGLAAPAQAADGRNVRVGRMFAQLRRRAPPRCRALPPSGAGRRTAGVPRAPSG